MSKAKLKQKAVQLKLAGNSLSEIALATGLSRPTIIAAYRNYSSNTAGKVSVGRPKLESIWLDASCIQALINTEQIFSAPDLQQYLELHHKRHINQRSFALLLQQVEWSKKIFSTADSCQIESTQDKIRNFYILHAQVKRLHLWSFHNSPPCDSD